MARAFEFASNHWMLFSGLLIVTFLLIQDLIDSMTRKHKLLSPTSAVALMNTEDDVTVIDVREPNEYIEGHIENARHITLGKVAEQLGDMDHNAVIIVTCHQGTRSAAACKTLTNLGYTRVHELQGGMMGWKDANLPVTRKRKSS